MRALYVVEQRAKNLPADMRLQLRQTGSAPVLNEMREKFLSWKRQLLPKHPMAEALSYALGQWEELRIPAKPISDSDLMAITVPG